jgi:GT2 family glycosyltransferase
VDISVVIVSYNSEGFLWENLNSVVKQTKRFKEIVVVDNRSQDRSLGIIAGFPQVRVIALHENCGYAGGANRGIKECTADLILVANADIILAPDFNASVIEKFAEDPDITLLSPLILRFDRQTVDSAGQALSRSLYPLEIGYNRSLSRVNPGEGPVFSVCGAATVFRRRSLEELELDGEYYDEDFFAFWEDLDIGWRAQLYGFKTYFYPGAIVYHYRSATLKRNFFSRFSLSLSRSTDIKYHLVKNRYLTLIKNFRFRDFWWTVPFAFLKDIIWVSVLTISAPKNIIRLFRSGRYFKNGFRKRKMIKEKLKQREAK